jgi:hypothetical protein
MKEKTLKVYRQPSIGRAYPEIRLSGKWLMKNGFQIGDYVRIAYKQDVILIKRMEFWNGQNV